MTHQIAWYLLLCFTTVVTPGAGVLYTVSGALRYGAGYAWPCIAGNAAGVFIVSCLTAGGLGAMIVASSVLFAAMQAIGALYLVYLGLKSWRAAPGDALAFASKGGRRPAASQFELFRDAVLLQGSNPLLFLFLFSLFPQFIVPESSFWIQCSVLIVIFCVMVLVVHAAYAIIATFARSALSGRSVFFWINRISGVIFLGLGAAVLMKLAAGA